MENNYENIRQYIRYVKAYNKQGLIYSSNLYLKKAIDLYIEISTDMSDNDLPALLIIGKELSELEITVNKLK